LLLLLLLIFFLPLSFAGLGVQKQTGGLWLTLVLIRWLFGCLRLQGDEFFFLCRRYWWRSLSLLLGWRWWRYYKGALGFTFCVSFLSGSTTSCPSRHAIRLVDPLAKQAGISHLVLEHWGWYHAAATTSTASLMCFIVITTTTGGVDGAGFASGVEAGAGRKPWHEDNAAFGAEQVGQAWVKCCMGEGNVANVNELPGEDSGVGGVGGEVGQGLLPEKLEAEEETGVHGGGGGEGAALLGVGRLGWRRGEHGKGHVEALQKAVEGRGGHGGGHGGSM